MVRNQRVQRRESGRRLDGPVDRAALAQGADDHVDLPGRLAGQLLDRLEGAQGAVGVFTVSEPGRAGADGDHADRVAGRVVEVAGDPGALLDGGELALALRLPLDARGPLTELGELLAPQPRPLAREP